MDSTSGVFCTICHKGLDHYTLSDGTATVKCPNGCNGGAAIPRKVMDTAIGDMDAAAARAKGGDE